MSLTLLLSLELLLLFHLHVHTAVWCIVHTTTTALHSIHIAHPSIQRSLPSHRRGLYGLLLAHQKVAIDVAQILHVHHVEVHPSCAWYAAVYTDAVDVVHADAYADAGSVVRAHYIAATHYDIGVD